MVSCFQESPVKRDRLVDLRFLLPSVCQITPYKKQEKVLNLVSLL